MSDDLKYKGAARSLAALLDDCDSSERVASLNSFLTGVMLFARSVWDHGAREMDTTGTLSNTTGALVLYALSELRDAISVMPRTDEELSAANPRLRQLVKFNLEATESYFSTVGPFLESLEASERPTSDLPS